MQTLEELQQENTNLRADLKRRDDEWAEMHTSITKLKAENEALRQLAGGRRAMPAMLRNQGE